MNIYNNVDNGLTLMAKVMVIAVCVTILYDRFS